MKENYSEIAEKITNTLFAPGQFHGKTWCKERITEALDQAHADGDKAGYERGVRESEAIVRDTIRRELFHLELATPGNACKCACNAILSLLAPPVPVWCRHAAKSEGGWQFTLDGNVYWSDYTGAFVCCPICGAPKPETKGS